MYKIKQGSEVPFGHTNRVFKRNTGPLEHIYRVFYLQNRSWDSPNPLHSSSHSPAELFSVQIEAELFSVQIEASKFFS